MERNVHDRPTDTDLSVPTPRHPHGEDNGPVQAKHKVLEQQSRDGEEVQPQEADGEQQRDAQQGFDDRHCDLTTTYVYLSALAPHVCGQGSSLPICPFHDITVYIPVAEAERPEHDVHDGEAEHDEDEAGAFAAGEGIGAQEVLCCAAGGGVFPGHFGGR